MFINENVFKVRFQICGKHELAKKTFDGIKMWF